MATYKNVSVGAHVHSGKVVPPNGTFEAESSANLEKLVKLGILTVDASAAGGEGDTAKAALLARAKELGIDAKGTWGVAKLQEAIAEAEKVAAGGEGT